MSDKLHVLLTCDPHVGRRADRHLPCQAVHGFASERRELIAVVQVVHQQLPGRQQVVLAVCGTRGPS